MTMGRSVSLLIFTYLENYETSWTRKRLVCIMMTGFLLFKSASGTKLDGLRKHATSIFQNKGLKVTMDTNLTSMDF